MKITTQTIKSEISKKFLSEAEASSEWKKCFEEIKNETITKIRFSIPEVNRFLLYDLTNITYKITKNI